MGRGDEARIHYREVKRISPGISLDDVAKRLPYKDEATLERVISSLRKTEK
jgi:hypothetical protein